jgi:hypothetical protein
MFVIILLTLSVSFNIQQYFSSKKKKKVFTVEANDLLHDLTNGGAIVKVTVINPAGLMLYRGES